MLVEAIKSITLSDIALTLAFIAGVIGSITAIGKVYKNAKQKRIERERAEMEAIVETAVKQAVEPLQKQLTETKAKVESLQTDLTKNNLQTSRLDLCKALETPHEHKAILALAEDYFLDQGGDAYVSGKFRKWAEDEGVDISYIASKSAHLKS